MAMQRDGQTLGAVAIGNASPIDFSGSGTNVACQLQTPGGSAHKKGYAVECQNGPQFYFSFSWE